VICWLPQIWVAAAKGGFSFPLEAMQGVMLGNVRIKGVEFSELDGGLRGEWVGMTPLLPGLIWSWICYQRWSPLRRTFVQQKRIRKKLGYGLQPRFFR